MLSLIFPAFNEAKNLQRFPQEVTPVLNALGRPWEAVIIDDGSSDDTASVAKSLGAPYRLVPHPRNLGLGAAVRTGMAAVTSSELVVTMDSDLTFAPKLIADLLKRFDRGDVDVVSGSPKLAGFDPNIPRYRVAISNLATEVYSWLLGQRLTAISPIFRLYRGALLRDLPLTATGFEINAEILLLLLQRGARVAEVPAPLTQRIAGESKLDYRREWIRHARLAGRILAWRVESLSPWRRP